MPLKYSLPWLLYRFGNLILVGFNAVAITVMVKYSAVCPVKVENMQGTRYPTFSKLARTMAKERYDRTLPPVRGSALLIIVLKRNPLWIGAMSAIMALQALLVLTHHPWIDEWQALQIALQSPDLASLLENLRYEGHPPLWYFYLQGVAAIVPPRAVLATAQLPIALALQALVLLRLPLPRIDRLLLGCGFLVLFDYGTLSRSLSLGVLLVTLAWLYRDRRWIWPIVALMPLVDFLFGVLSIIVIAVQWQERRLWNPGIALWLVCSLIAAWTVRPAADIVSSQELDGPLLETFVWIVRLSALLVPFPLLNGVPTWNNPLPPTIAMVIGPLFLIFAYKMLARDRFHLLLFSGFTLLTWLFSIFVYPLAIRHLSLIAWLLILLIARANAVGTPPAMLFRPWILVSAVCGLFAATYNLVVAPFDTAHRAAAYIENRDLSDKPWIVFPNSHAQGIAAMQGMRFVEAGRSCSQDFVRWNHAPTVRDIVTLERALDRKSKARGRLYLITRVAPEEWRYPDRYRLLTHIPAGYDGQTFYLYVVRPDLPESGWRPPTCAPDRLPLQL